MEALNFLSKEIINKGILYDTHEHGYSEFYFNIADFHEVILILNAQNIKIEMIKIWEKYLNEMLLQGVLELRNLNQKNNLISIFEEYYKSLKIETMSLDNIFFTIE
jgi:hypothetical protein